MNSALPFKILKYDDDGDTATVYLYGRIGQQPSDYSYEKRDQDITDVAFLQAMRDIEKSGKKRANVRINSPGGSMLHMDGIIAAMRSTKVEVHTYNDGVAASAAGDIFLSVPKARRHMAKNAKLMLHEPQGICMGTAKLMRDTADMLDVFAEGSIAQMAADTGMSEEDVKSTYFDGADHWLSARQAVDAGFVTAVEDYEAQQVPANPEKMSAAELLKFYQPTMEADEPSWVQKIISALVPVKAIVEVPIQQKDEEMNLQNLETSFGKEITEDEVVKFLQGKGFDVTKKAEPAAPDIAKLVKDAIAEATKPLSDKIEDLQKQLDTTPGSDPTPAKAAGDPPSEEEPVEITPEEKAAQDNFAKKVQAEKRGGDW